MTSYLQAALLGTIPLVFAGMGGILLERVGIFAVALEGLMLLGAFFATVGAHVGGSPWVGVPFAAAVGALAGCGLIGAVQLRANQIVVGIGVNLLASGVTSFLLPVLFAGSTQAQVPGLPHWPVPGLSQLPVLGTVFFDQPFLTYAGYCSVPATFVLVSRTRFGLAVRAVGEGPREASSMGVRVPFTRMCAGGLCGLLAALGGAVLSLEQLHFFALNMTGGAGYIAWACLVLGRWNAFGVALAAALLGAAAALPVYLQIANVDVSPYLLLMLPFGAAIVAIRLGGGVRYPAAMGKVFAREER